MIADVHVKNNTTQNKLYLHKIIFFLIFCFSLSLNFFVKYHCLISALLFICYMYSLDFIHRFKRYKKITVLIFRFIYLIIKYKIDQGTGPLQHIFIHNHITHQLRSSFLKALKKFMYSQNKFPISLKIYPKKSYKIRVFVSRKLN